MPSIGSLIGSAYLATHSDVEPRPRIYPITYQWVRQLVLDEWKSLSVPLMHPLKLRASLNLDLKLKKNVRNVTYITLRITRMFLSEP